MSELTIYTVTWLYSAGFLFTIPMALNEFGKGFFRIAAAFGTALVWPITWTVVLIGKLTEK